MPSVLIRHFGKLSTGILKIRRFDRLRTSAVRAKAQFSDKTVTNPPATTCLITPALRLGLKGTRPTGALALTARQPVCERTRSDRHEVVHAIYCLYKKSERHKCLCIFYSTLNPSKYGICFSYLFNIQTTYICLIYL